MFVVWEQTHAYVHTDGHTVWLPCPITYTCGEGNYNMITIARYIPPSLAVLAEFPRSFGFTSFPLGAIKTIK